MADESAKKIVTTWAELEEEATKLSEWYASALAASEAILEAAACRSEVLLRKALERHKGLKAMPPFRVSPAVYGSEGTTPTLVLVN